MHHRVRAVQRPGHRIGVTHVADREPGADRLQTLAGRGAAVGVHVGAQRVQDEDVVAVGAQPPGHGTADEPGTAGQGHPHAAHAGTAGRGAAGVGTLRPANGGGRRQRGGRVTDG